MTDNRTDTRSPDQIEREIRDTQRDMSRTVDQLEGELTPRNLFNSLLDKADENNIDARYLLDAARRNPLALGMIAIGGLWLVSDAEARPSALKPSSGGSNTSNDHDWDDPYHRSYVEHMARCEPRPEEDDLAYRRRRDNARASYLMIEQRHDEDESSFRKRLDEATDSMRERRERMAEQARNAGRRTREQMGRAAAGARGFYYDNPLLAGLAAGFVGAIAGSAAPVSRSEEEYLGGAGEKALDRAEGAARQAGEKAREKKDEMVEKADRTMTDGGDRNPQGNRKAGSFETA